MRLGEPVRLGDFVGVPERVLVGERDGVPVREAVCDGVRVLEAD